MKFFCITSEQIAPLLMFNAQVLFTEKRPHIIMPHLCTLRFWEMEEVGRWPELQKGSDMFKCFDFP